ncbi:hypothetical protein L1887_14538 [Cichorium endivia]|nr:hypothetical protein L1887_14538 [Cichorium endivia]
MEVTAVCCVLGVASFFMFFAWRLSNSLWFEPKKKEKLLRDQGLNGTSYKFMFGDLKELVQMTSEAKLKPMSLTHDIVPRVSPFFYKSLSTYDPLQLSSISKAEGRKSISKVVGNVHGKYPPSGPKLRLQLLKDLYDLASKNGVFLVLHGASGLPKELVQECIELGVRKFNVNTEVRKAYMDILKSPQSDLVHVITAAKEAMKAVVAEKMHLFGFSDPPLMEVTAICCVLGVALVFMFFVWRLSNSLWFEPKKKEKLLRDQGVNGSSYKFMFGDLKELVQMTSEAKLKPMSLTHDIVPRVSPFFYKSLSTYGKNSFIWMGTKPMHINMSHPLPLAYSVSASLSLPSGSVAAPVAPRRSVRRGTQR